MVLDSVGGRDVWTPLAKYGDFKNMSMPWRAGSISNTKVRKAVKNAIGTATKTKDKKKKVVIRRSVGPARMGKRIRHRRYRITKAQRKTMSGLSLTREVGGEVVTVAPTNLEGGQVAWLGHHCTALQDVRTMLWQLALKKLMAKSGLNIRDINNTAELVTAGDVFAVEYQTQDGIVTSLNHVYVAGQSWALIAGIFSANVVLNDESSTAKFFTFLPTVNAVGGNQDRAPCRIDLEHAFVHVYCRSNMKIQNRTTNGTDTQVDEVDNCPLVGRVYAGNGNGVHAYINGGVVQNSQLIARISDGLIFGKQSDSGMREPLAASFFQGAKRSGPLLLQPGVVRTSTLVYRRKISFNSLRKMLKVDTDATDIVKVKTAFGKFAFFGLERALFTNIAETIKVGFEANHLLSMDMSFKFINTTVPRFVSSIVNFTSD